MLIATALSAVAAMFSAYTAFSLNSMQENQYNNAQKSSSTNHVIDSFYELSRDFPEAAFCAGFIDSIAREEGNSADVQAANSGNSFRFRPTPMRADRLARCLEVPNRQHMVDEISKTQNSYRVSSEQAQKISYKVAQYFFSLEKTAMLLYYGVGDKCILLSRLELVLKYSGILVYINQSSFLNLRYYLENYTDVSNGNRVSRTPRECRKSE